eukprot:CAMPEP_0202486608 /NCGR_PEP_ID=MMETSP1361-20130828/5125_1 /ASSEMBLY_ACC=CAM_ASM_000849 /TAXON_ID=210615 /ORGANISM="Staurosira complex sp., Strain CCMP2646" /LENGTH=178 /DNA_ID=CAMNT_0049115791 /DNA_START=108 /DNA_END=645 /DNA_ORIENTATION=+
MKDGKRSGLAFPAVMAPSNDAIKGESDRKLAAAGRVSSKIIFIQSSSEESNGLNDSSARAKPSELNKATTTTRPSKPRKSQNKEQMLVSSGGTKSKKTATAPVFKAEKTNPFGISQTSVDFVVRGKPHPQYRDKPGWNRTRHNPSKTLQKQFGRVAIEQFLNDANRVPDFGPAELEWK